MQPVNAKTGHDGNHSSAKTGMRYISSWSRSQPTVGIVNLIFKDSGQNADGSLTALVASDEQYVAHDVYRFFETFRRRCRCRLKA